MVSEQVGTPRWASYKALTRTSRLYEAYTSLLDGCPLDIYPPRTVLESCFKAGPEVARKSKETEDRRAELPRHLRLTMRPGCAFPGF